MIRVTARAPASLVAALRRQSDGTQEQPHGQTLAVLTIPGFACPRAAGTSQRQRTPARPGSHAPRARTALLVPRGTGLPSVRPAGAPPCQAAARDQPQRKGAFAMRCKG